MLPKHTVYEFFENKIKERAGNLIDASFDLYSDSYKDGLRVGYLSGAYMCVDILVQEYNKAFGEECPMNKVRTLKDIVSSMSEKLDDKDAIALELMYEDLIILTEEKENA